LPGCPAAKGGDELHAELGWILAWWVGGRDESEGGPYAPHVLNARRVLANQLGWLGDGEQALAISREIAETAAGVHEKDPPRHHSGHEGNPPVGARPGVN
jgi:hypothetical protein